MINNLGFWIFHQNSTFHQKLVSLVKLWPFVLINFFGGTLSSPPKIVILVEYWVFHHKTPQKCNRGFLYIFIVFHHKTLLHFSISLRCISGYSTTKSLKLQKMTKKIKHNLCFILLLLAELACKIPYGKNILQKCKGVLLVFL